ncbi:4'-phosphopantetheinyl transferase family protein [Streptomyces chiangmaiensis]
MRVELWLLGRPEHGRSAATLDLSILDEEERHRAGTCRRSAGGALYATAHIALRRLLGDRLCMPAAELFFVREPCPGCGEPHGRPALAAPSADVHFSLSHSNGMVLIGIAGTPIGVDVEPVPRSETVRICTPALHPAEREEVLAVPEGLPAGSPSVGCGPARSRTSRASGPGSPAAWPWTTWATIPPAARPAGR